MSKKSPDRTAARLHRDAAVLRFAAGSLAPGRLRASLLYGALYAETSAERRQAAEDALSAAAEEIIAKFPLQ